MKKKEQHYWENWERVADGLKPIPYWLWLVKDYFMVTIYLPLQSKLCKHHFVDDDPGDPEVGPQPDIYCTKCGLHY